MEQVKPPPVKRSGKETWRAKSKKEPLALLALFISILGFCLSVWSLYLQFFWRSHDLKFSVVETDFLLSPKRTVTVLFLNRGNQTEVVLSARVVAAQQLTYASFRGAFSRSTFPPAATFYPMGDHKTWFSPDIGSPILLSPGDASTQTLNVTFASWRELESAGILDGRPAELWVGVLVGRVDSSGQIAHTVIPVIRVEPDYETTDSFTQYDFRPLMIDLDGATDYSGILSQRFYP